MVNSFDGRAGANEPVMVIVTSMENHRRIVFGKVEVLVDLGNRVDAPT